MIKINLLPEELRVKPASPLSLPWVRALGVVGVLLFFTTFALYIDFWTAQVKLKKIKREWALLEPQSAVLLRLKTIVEGELRPEAEFIQKTLLGPPSTAHLLLKISEYLPDAVWLTEIESNRIETYHLTIKGKCAPLTPEPCLEKIENFAHKLAGGLPDMRLKLHTSLQQAGNMQITEFIAVFNGAGAKV